MNCNLCDDLIQSVPHIKQYIKPGDIYSLDITKFVDLQTNSVDFRSNVDYVQLPGYSKDVRSLDFKDINFNPIETKYGNGSFFILQNDQRTVLRLSQLTLQIENFVLENYLQEYQTLKCNDLIIQDKFLWILCKDETQINDNEFNYRIITIDYLMNQIITDVQFYSHDLQNPKFKLIDKVENNIGFFVFDKQIQKGIKHQSNYQIDIIKFSIDKKASTQEDQNMKDEVTRLTIVSIPVELSSLLGNFFDKKNSNFKIFNIMVDQVTHNSFIVLQEEAHKGKHVFQCDLNKKQNGCSKFIDQKVAHFFYKNSNYLFIDESLTLKFCQLNSDKSSTCKEGAMKKNWKIINVNLEYNRGLIAVEDDSNYYVFINDYSTGYFNWYKDDLNDVKKIQLFQSDIQDGSHHIYYMMKLKQNTCDLQDLTFNKSIIIDSKNIKKNEKIEISLSNIKLLSMELILWNGQSLINYLDQDKVDVIQNENQLYTYKMPWITQAPQFITNEVQQIEHFDQIKLRVFNKTQQESNFLLQNSVMIQHNNRLYSFQENYVNIFIIAELTLNFELTLYQEQYIEYGLLKDNQLRNIEKHGSVVLFNDYEENKISIFQLDQNSLNTYDFKHDEKLQKCLVNTDFFICSVQQEDQNSNWLNLYKFNDDKEIIYDEESTQILNQKLNEFIKTTTNFKEFNKILISDFDLDSCNDEKFVVIFNLFTQNKQQPLLTEIKIKNHQNQNINFVFKQLFKNDLNAGDVTDDDKIYIYNGQTIVVQSEPIFKVFIQKSSSFTQMPFLEATSVRAHKINKQRGLLAVIYRSSFNQEDYIALYQLTSDAAIQFIANKNIQQLELDYDVNINITSLTDKHVLINILQDQDNIIKISYVLNQTGPILYTKELSNEIIINEQGINIESKLDLKLMLSDFKYITDNILRVHKFEDTLYELKQFIEIEGNVKDIEIMQPDQNQINSKVIKVLNSIEQFHMLDYSFLHRHCNRCILNDQNVISASQDQDEKYFLTNIDSLQSIEIGNNNCLDFDYDLANEIFLCLKHQPNKISVSTYMYLQNDQYKEDDKNQIEVPFDSISIKLVYNTISIQVFKLENSQKNKITFIVNNATNQTRQKLTIDGKLLQSDMLFIKDNFSFVESTSTELLLHTVIYDQRANKIYINGTDLKTGTNIPFINKIIDLNVYETQTYGLSCQEIDLKFECYLIGKLNIYQLIFSKENNTGFNRYDWNIKRGNVLKNSLYDQVDDLNFQPIVVFNDKHLILANKDPSLSLKQIVHYYKTKQYTDYVYEIGNLKTLMDIQIKERSSAQTIVLLLKNELNQIEVQILKLNDDTLIKISQSDKKSLIENRQMKVNFMNGSNLMVDFQIINNVEVLDNESISFFQRHWFVVSMVLLLCILAFFLLIVLLVLLRERKKINLRMAMLNEGNSNVPLTEI